MLDVKGDKRIVLLVLHHFLDAAVLAVFAQHQIALAGVLDRNDAAPREELCSGDKALIDSYKLIIVHFKERNDSLGLSIGSFNMTSSPTDGCPGSTKASSPLREECILCNPANHDGFDAIIHFVEITIMCNNSHSGK